MNPDLPPPNRALGWYRFMLWMMPTCIAITTAFGIDWLGYGLGHRDDLLVVIGFALNLASTIGIGIFESRFHRHWDGSVERPGAAGVVKFVLLQFIIVPVMIWATLIAWVVISGGI